MVSSSVLLGKLFIDNIQKLCLQNEPFQETTTTHPIIEYKHFSYTSVNPFNTGKKKKKNHKVHPTAKVKFIPARPRRTKLFCNFLLVCILRLWWDFHFQIKLFQASLGQNDDYVWVCVCVSTGYNMWRMKAHRIRTVWKIESVWMGCRL